MHSIRYAFLFMAAAFACTLFGAGETRADQIRPELARSPALLLNRREWQQETSK